MKHILSTVICARRAFHDQIDDAGRSVIARAAKESCIRAQDFDGAVQWRLIEMQMKKRLTCPPANRSIFAFR